VERTACRTSSPLDSVKEKSEVAKECVSETYTGAISQPPCSVCVAHHYQSHEGEHRRDQARPERKRQHPVHDGPRPLVLAALRAEDDERGERDQHVRHDLRGHRHVDRCRVCVREKPLPVLVRAGDGRDED
jgi:hypothetical protein